RDAARHEERQCDIVGEPWIIHAYTITPAAPVLSRGFCIYRNGQEKTPWTTPQRQPGQRDPASAAGQGRAKGRLPAQGGAGEDAPRDVDEGPARQGGLVGQVSAPASGASLQ